MRQSRRRTDSGCSADDKIEYMRMVTVPLVTVLALVAIILVMDKKPSSKGAPASTDISLSMDGNIDINGGNLALPRDEGVEPDNSQYITDFSQYELKKNEMPRADQLISEYFQIKVNQDVQTLYRIFEENDDTGLDTRKEELKNKAIYTEDYVDIVCYTRSGLTADSYVVHVTYEVKSRHAETLAPSLMWCYVVKDDNGSFIIRENIVGDEADYVARQNQPEDVKLSLDQVNERLRQVIEGDTVLAGIYKDLRNEAMIYFSEEKIGTGDNTVILEGEGGFGIAGGPSMKIEQAWRMRLTMDVKDLDYELPEELIAQDSSGDRSASRLMALDRETGEVQHRTFKGITQYLWSGDCLVTNDTKAVSAQLFGAKKDTGAKIEVLLLKCRGSDTWEIPIYPGKKVKPRTVIELGKGLLTGTVVDTVDDGNCMIQFCYEGILGEILDQLGQMLLSPYITHQLKDKNHHQTVYARYESSTAVPTMGLHLTQKFLIEIEGVGVKIARVILHVGLSIFHSVKMENVQDHHMHPKFYIMEESGAEEVSDTKTAGGRVICVGTISCRTVESVSTEDSAFRLRTGWTEIFTYPGYHSKVLDVLTTNFYLPQPTLMMLVSALTEREYILNAYREAMKERYHFSSFGDVMFITAHPAVEKRQGLWE